VGDATQARGRHSAQSGNQLRRTLCELVRCPDRERSPRLRVIRRFRRAGPEPSLAIVNRKLFTLLPITSRLSCCLKLTSFKVFNLDGAKNKNNRGRLNMGIRNAVEIFNGQGRRLDDSAQRSASNECVRLIRKLRWIGMDDEAERVLAQLSGWPFRPTETVIAGPWATD
jgi:hypothetical protein